MGNEPKGVVGTLIMSDGHVLASVNDFARDGYGGMKLWEAQRHRVRMMLANAAISNSCSPWIVKAIDTYRASEIRDTLIREHGFREHFHYIGHGDVDE